MAAKVINFHSPDGKNTYELTFTRDSVEATERAGFQIGQYTQMTNLLSNSRACSTARLSPGIVASSVKSWTKCLPTSTRRKS
jgi:hypothetical protein